MYLIIGSDVNKATCLKAKAGPFQGQAKAKAECLQEQDKPSPHNIA